MKKHLIMILVLILVAGTMAACGGDDGGSAGYTDGTYQGEADGFGGTIKVSVTVEDGKIADVEIVEHTESEGFSDDAIDNMPGKIVSSNSTDVDVESGATISSEGIKAAVEDALGAAK